MLSFKVSLATAILTFVLTGGMAFAQTDMPSEEVAPESNNNIEESDNNNNIANGTSSNSGVEKVTVKAQLKPTGLLKGWYDIKKFRLGVSDGSEICPSNNCEYRVEGGKIFALGDNDNYRADGKLKVTIPADGSSKSTLYPLGVTMDKTGEEEAKGNTLEKFSGTFEIGPHITYVITNATLEVDKKSPILTIQAERGNQNSTDSE
jgi:hypothetical protein